MGNLKAFFVSFFLGLLYILLKGISFYSFAFLISSTLLYFSFPSIYFFFIFPFFLVFSAFSIGKASKIVAITAPLYFYFYSEKKSKHKRTILRKTIHILLSLLLIAFFLISIQNSLIFTLLIFEIGLFLYNIQKTKIYSINFLKIDEDEFLENAFKAFWLVLAFLYLFSFFDKKIVLLSALVLCISDSLAAFGKFGKRKIYNEKTLLGSFLFFASSLFIASFFIPFHFAVLYSFLLSFVEAFSPIEDNFPIAFFSSLFLKLFGLVS
jgi:dolichol kinase